MGKSMIGKTKPHPSGNGWWLAILGAGLLLACAGLVPLPVPPPSQIDPDETWLMLGKNPQHHHAVNHNVHPPIAPVWKRRLHSVVTDHPLAFGSYILATLRNGNLAIFSLSQQEQIAMDRIGPTMGHVPSIYLPFLYAGFNLGKHTLLAINLRNTGQEFRRQYPEVTTSPIYWDRKLYFGTNRGQFFCVNARSGDSIWTFKSRVAIQASPAIRDPLVVFADVKGNVYALDVSSGIMFWQTALDAAIFSHPVLDDSLVFVATVSGLFVALDQKNGKPRWQTRLNGSIYSSASLYQNFLYVGTNGHEVVALRKTDGSVLWRFQTNGIVNTVPLSSPDYVYVGSWDGNLYILNRFTGKLIFKQELNAALKSSPIIYQQYLIVHSANKHLWVFATEKFAREMKTK